MLAVMLLAQNFSFTVVSRARNSGSDTYHAVAAVFSNAIWVVVNVLLFKQWMDVWETGSLALFAGVALFYITFTVLGSVLGGRIARRYFETGKRRVGHYDSQEERIRRLEGAVITMGLSVKGVIEHLDAEHAARVKRSS